MATTIDFSQIILHPKMFEKLEQKGPKFTNNQYKYYLERSTDKFNVVDFDKNEKTIEVEFKDGDRQWLPLTTFFGKVLEPENIKFHSGKGFVVTARLHSVGTRQSRKKEYFFLIFEDELPF